MRSIGRYSNGKTKKPEQKTKQNPDTENALGDDLAKTILNETKIKQKPNK